MQRTLSLAVIALSAIACGDTPAPTELIQPDAPLFSTAPEVIIEDFYAVAQCSADIGFNILFGGERVLLSHVTKDASGNTHKTLQFRVQDFQGWTTMATTPPADPPTSDPDFDVQGGAEMFTFQTNNTIQIHQGNLVFESLTDDTRVVAHHTIRDVPGQETVNFWSCRIIG